MALFLPVASLCVCVCCVRVCVCAHGGHCAVTHPAPHPSTISNIHLVLSHPAPFVVNRALPCATAALDVSLLLRSSVSSFLPFSSTLVRSVAPKVFPLCRTCSFLPPPPHSATSLPLCLPSTPLQIFTPLRTTGRFVASLYEGDSRRRHQHDVANYPHPHPSHPLIQFLLLHFCPRFCEYSGDRTRIQ